MKLATRGVVIGTLVSALGIGLLWRGTDGFSAFTAETARRVALLRAPRSLPAAVLEDQDGHIFGLQDYRGRLLAVEFIYTRCNTVCSTLGMAFRQIREHVPQHAFERDFALLSISFDTEADAPRRLKAYGDAYGADGRHWRVARVRNSAELKPLLDAFGIIVIADGLGGFEHNAAIHLLGRDGRLASISDINEPIPFAETLMQWL
jgi:protein SCO1/2